MANKNPISDEEMASIRKRDVESRSCLEDVYIDRRVLLDEVIRLNQLVSDLESQLVARNRALAVSTTLLANTSRQLI